MNQPVPEVPINVQRTNPYAGPDRGLFLIHYPAGPKLARVHAARYVTHGPNGAVGVLEYQVMQYNQMPTTPAEYAAGVLLNAPDGSQWFDRLVRGAVLDPILVEYWANDSFINWYHGEDGAKLTQQEKDKVKVQGTEFTTTMGGFAGLKAIELSATYNSVDGAPISRISAVLEIDYERDGEALHTEESNLPAGEFDPVRQALSILKTK